MKPIGDRLYFLAEHGLASAVFADHIDPDRTNPAIPQIVQQVELGYGIDQQFIRKTVGAAFELADPTYLPDGVIAEEVLSITIEAAKSLASVIDVVRDLKVHQDETRAMGQSRKLSAAYVPHTPNLNARVRQCLAAMRDVDVAVKRLTGKFYPKSDPKDPWDLALKAALQAKYGAVDGFETLIDRVWQTLEAAADHRHAMIHPDGTKLVLILDYQLQPEGAFVAPTIEIRHPRSAVSRRDVVQFLETQVEHIADSFEALLGYLCDLNVKKFNAAFESGVSALETHRNGSHLTWVTRIVGDFPDSKSPQET